MVTVHPTARVETEDVGEGTIIGAFCYIGKNVFIGKNCRIGAFTSIGGAPQYKSPIMTEENGIIILDNVVTKEFVTINLPVGRHTFIGTNCYLMTKSHIAHDVELQNDVIVCSGAAISGFSRIGKFTYIGANASVHQHSDIGSYCIVGASSFFKGSSPEGITWAGVRAKPIKVNLINIKRNAPKEERGPIIFRAQEYCNQLQGG